MVYINESSLVSVSDSKGKTFIYDIIDGSIHQETKVANPPILGQIYYPNLMQATVSKQQFSVVNLLTKEEVIGIQSLDQDINYLGLVQADISKTIDEQSQGGFQRQSSLIILINRKTQVLSIKPSSEDNNYYPTYNDNDYLIKVKGQTSAQQGIFGKNQQNQVDMYCLIENYQVNPNQNFLTITENVRVSMMVGFNQGVYNSVYAYLVNFSIIDQQKLVDYISPVILPASVNKLIQMNGTKYIIISYGAKTNFAQQGGQGGGMGGGGGGGGQQVTSPLTLKENNLCIYDFGNAQRLSDSTYGVDILQVLQNPLVCQDMGSDLVMGIENIKMNDRNYMVFSLFSQSLLIFDNSDLISSNFTITHGKNLKVTNYLKDSITYMLQIPNLAILIAGTNSGIVASFDISDPNIISHSSQITSSLELKPLFSKSGTGSNGSTLADIIFEDTTQTYDFLKQQRTSEINYIYQQSGGGGGGGNQKQIIVESAVAFKNFSFMSLTSITKQYYPKGALTSCPTKNPTTTPTDLTTVKILSLVTSNQVSPLDLQVDNLNPQQISGMLSYVSELNEQYAAILVVTKPFIFSGYCEYFSNGKIRLLNEDLKIEFDNKEEALNNKDQLIDISINKQKRLLQDTSMSLQIYFINNQGVSIFKTNNNFYQLDSLDKAPIQFIKDDLQNLFIVFQDSITIVKPQANIPSNIQFTTISLFQLETLASITDIKKIYKVVILAPLNLLIIQLDKYDQSQMTLFVSYDQYWSKSQTRDPKIILLKVINNQVEISLKSLLRFNTMYYMSKQNIIVTQYNTNIDLFKYDISSSSLTLHLTLQNVADGFTKFFSLKDDSSLYKISQDGEIQKIYAPQCYDQSCINTSCSIQVLVNQQKTNQLNDILKNQGSNIFVKQEQILKKSLDFSNLITKISNLDVKRSFYFASGSQYSMKYIHFKQIVSQDYLVQHVISLRLKIHAFNISASDLVKDEGIITSVELFSDQPLIFDNYSQVSIKNINLNVNQDNYLNKSMALIQISNSISIFDNFEMKTFSILCPDKIDSSFNKISINYGHQIIFRNMNLKNKIYKNADYFIKTPDSDINILMENLIVQDCLFEQTVFLLAQNLANLTAKNIHFIHNIILQSQVNTDSTSFMQAQTYQLQYFYFQKNSIESITILGKTVKSSMFTAELLDSEISQNVYFFPDSSINSLFLNVEFLQVIQSQTSLSLKNIQIFQNEILKKQYLKEDFDKYLQSLNQTSGQIPPDNQIDDSDTIKYLNDYTHSIQLFNTKYINIITIDNVKLLDNNKIGFYLGSYLTSFSANKLKCKNTWLNSNVPNSSCVFISDYNTIKFELIDGELENQFLYNNYLIYLKTTSFSRQINQIYESTFTISNLKVKNIKIQTQTEYNQASTIFFNSLQNNLIKIEKLDVQNVLLQTPLKVFYDMASCLSLLTPFSSASLLKSQFTNLYTQSIKEALYLNVEDLKMDSNNFENNQFQTVATLKGTNGGFLNIRTGILTIKNNSFYKGTSLNGAAITLIPTKSNKFILENCRFSNLISSKYGAALYIVEPPQMTTFEFKNCQFTSLLAQEGGSIYSQYFANESNDNQNQQYPSLTISSPRVNQTFSSYEGSFISVHNVKVEINDLIVDINNPNQKIQKQNMILLQKLNKFQQIGSLLYFQNSIIIMRNSKINQVHILPKQGQSSILTLQKNSNGTIENVDMIDGSFSSQGCLLIEDQSVINLNTVKINNMKYNQIINPNRNLQNYQDEDMKLSLAQLIDLSISTLKIRNQSKFEINQLIMDSNQCLSNYCVGSALSIIQSEGNIKNSYFINNNSTNKGGAMSIISPSQQINIINSEFSNNNAGQEGGGLFVQTLKENGSIQISENSKFISNKAKQGGGMYLNCLNQQKSTSDGYNWMKISDTIIKENKASFLGGGIQYEGIDPFISPSTKIISNTAGQGYGGNLFSRPFKLKFNQALTSQSNNIQAEFQVTQDTVIGVERISLGVQRSGGVLPDLIFNLVDENNQEIDSSYEQIISSSIIANLQPYETQNNNDLAFILPESYQKFKFTNYFNLTGIKIVGIPNTSISIKLTSPNINNPNYHQNGYFVIIDIHLRECLRGEIYKANQIVYKGQNLQFQECLRCPEGQQIQSIYHYTSKIFFKKSYSLVEPNLQKPITECLKCKENAECQGGDNISLKEGYWRESDQTDQILQCVNKQSNCLGGNGNSTCSQGHIGPLCESCDIENGYSRQGSFQCSDCGDTFINSLKVIGLVILYILCAKLSVDGVLQRIMFIIKRKEQISKQVQQAGISGENVRKSFEREEHNASILLKLIINYFQVITVVTTFQINIPNVFSNSIEVISNPTIQVLYSFECFFYELSITTGINIIYVQLIASVSLPLLCALVFIITGLIQYRKNKYLMRFYIYTSLIYCLMYFQPSLFKDTISLISCRMIGGASYIQYNVLYTCYTEEHIFWSLSLVLPILLMITVIIPGTLMYKVYKSKDFYLKRKNFMFLIGEYEMEKRKIWYWEFIKMYMKLLIMSFLTIYEYKIPNKILFILLTIVLYGFLLLKIKPYEQKLYNQIDIYSTLVLISSIYLGFVAYENQNSLPWKISILIGIGAINTFFLVWCFQKLAHAYLPMVKKKLFEIKFTCFKLSPFRCLYTRRTARIYKFQKWVKSVQNELKKRNIINAWTGKIKVPLEDIIDLIVQGREQMKNGSKCDINNNSIRNKSQNKIQKNTDRQIEEIPNYNQSNEVNIISKKIIAKNQTPSDIESINLEFPSENLIIYSADQLSHNILTARNLPQSILRQSENNIIKRQKNTSIVVQDNGAKNSQIQIIPLSSKIEDNQSTNRNLLSPITTKSKIYEQFGSLRKILQPDSPSQKRGQDSSRQSISDEQPGKYPKHELVQQQSIEVDTEIEDIPIENQDDERQRNQDVCTLNRNFLRVDKVDQQFQEMEVQFHQNNHQEEFPQDE